MSEGNALPQALMDPRPTRNVGDPAYGLWPGTVVSRNDPNKEGRLQVRVDQFYGAASEAEKIEDTDLPWARPGNFLAGPGSGMPAVPDVGAGVWVGFWGGSREHPVWFGGFYGSSDVPSEFSSSYAPDPQTWLVKTPHGHVIEMRWKNAESEVYILTKQGIKLRLIDAPPIGGLKIIATTPGGFEFAMDEPNKVAHIKTPAGREMMLNDQTQIAHVKSPTGREMVLNDAAQEAHLVTPTQRIELLDTVPAINVTTPGSVNVNGATSAIVQSAGPTTVQSGGLLTLATAGGLTIGGVGGGPMGGATNIDSGGLENKTFAGAANWTYGAFSLNVLAALAMTAVALLTLTGAGVAIITTAAAVAIGSAAAATSGQAVVLASFIAKYNAHKHSGVTSGGDLSGTTDTPATSADLSQNVKVD